LAGSTAVDAFGIGGGGSGVVRGRSSMAELAIFAGSAFAGSAFTAFRWAGLAAFTFDVATGFAFAVFEAVSLVEVRVERADWAIGAARVALLADGRQSTKVRFYG